MIAQWACWMSGSTAVPLDPQQTETNLIYCIGDADCDVVIADRSYVDKVKIESFELDTRMLIFFSFCRSTTSASVVRRS